MIARSAEVVRNTAETRIRVALNLDGSGTSRLSTGIGFFDHMLDQIARHGAFDLTIEAKGDLHIDGHHTVEDVGITLGQAVAKAIGDKKGIRRYGHAYVPLDEALSRVVVDFSGRPGLVMNVPFTRAKRCSRPSPAPCAWPPNSIRVLRAASRPRRAACSDRNALSWPFGQGEPHRQRRFAPRRAP